MGERSPVWDAQASGAFIGLSLRHRRGHLYRAVLEGVAYALRHNIDAGLRGAGALDERLVVVGGASRSDLWMHIIADVTGRPVHTLPEDVEASLGAALLAAHGAGLIDAAAVRRGWLAPRLRATPDAAAMRVHEAGYAQYVAACPALAPVMHGLAAGRRTDPS